MNQAKNEFLNEEKVPWTIGHSSELWASAFLTMPEGASLPKDLAQYRYDTYRTREATAPVVDSLARLDLTGPANQCIPALTLEEVNPSPWHNVVSPGLLIKVHHISTSYLTQGISEVLELVEDSEIAISERNLDPPPSTGTCIIECTFPLRMVADLEKFDGGIFVHEDKGDTSWHDQYQNWPWIFEENYDQDWEDEVGNRVISGLLDSITQVRALQRGVFAINRIAAPLISIANSPSMIPTTVHYHQSWSKNAEDTKKVFLLRPSQIDTMSKEFQKEELDLLDYTLERADGGMLSGYLDLIRESESAHRSGNTRVAALLSGVAAESLFTDLILHLLWEESHTPECAASDWPDSNDKRIKTNLGKIKLNWNLQRDSPLREWYFATAQLRNRVAHSAYEPTNQEAQSSIEAVMNLVSYLCDLLAANGVRNKYPRTAIAIAGHTGLKDRGVWNRRMQEITEDPNEPNWGASFKNWYEIWRLVRRKESTQLSEENLLGLLISRPDGRQEWFLWDQTNQKMIAATAEPSASMQHAIDSSIDLAAGNLHIGSFESATDWIKPVPGAVWVWEYRKHPWRNALCNGSDLTLADDQLCGC